MIKGAPKKKTRKYYYFHKKQYGVYIFFKE